MVLGTMTGDYWTTKLKQGLLQLIQLKQTLF